VADSSSLFDHTLVAQLESEKVCNISEQTSEKDPMAEVTFTIPVKVEESESDSEDALSPFTESSPNSPDSGIDGDALEDLAIFGDVGGLVGNPTIDEILVSEEEVSNIASNIEPTLNGIVVDDMEWEDPFLDLFPSLMAV